MTRITRQWVMYAACKFAVNTKSKIYIVKGDVEKYKLNSFSQVIVTDYDKAQKAKAFHVDHNISYGGYKLEKYDGKGSRDFWGVRLKAREFENMLGFSNNLLAHELKNIKEGK